MHPEKISCYVTSDLYKQIANFKVSITGLSYYIYIYPGLDNLKFFCLQFEDSVIVYQYELSEKKYSSLLFGSLELVLAIMEDVNQKALYRTQLLVTRKRSLCKI